MPYASSEDVAALMARELSPEETAMVERRLAQAERMILRRVPDLAEQIEDGALDADDVRDIEAEAVLRVVQNPDGLVSETEGTYTYVKSRETADNTLRLTAEEWSVLGIRPSRMFSLSPTIGGRP